MQIEALNPVFPCKDVKASLAYYKDMLGFAGEFEWEEEGVLSYAIINLGEQSLHLTQTDKETTPSIAYVFCAPVDKLYEQMKAAGAIIRSELQEYPWKMREFEVADPDGNRLIFGEGIE